MLSTLLCLLCILGFLSFKSFGSIIKFTNNINAIKLQVLRNEKIKRLLYSEKYKKFRSKIKKTKTKLQSWYYDSVNNYYSISEEERILIDTITDLLYN